MDNNNDKSHKKRKGGAEKIRDEKKQF